MRLLERLILDYPLLVVLALTIISVVLLPGLFQIRLDVSVENFVPDSDVERIRYRQLIDNFGNDTFILAMFPVESAFSDDTLRLVRRLSGLLRELPPVSGVFSITDAVLIDHSGHIPVLRPLVSTLPLTEEQRQELRDTVRSHSLYRHKVVSADGRNTLISVYLDNSVETDDRSRAAAVREVQEILQREIGGDELMLTGVPLLKTEISDAVHHDIITLAPAVALVSLLVLWLAFRSLWVLVISVATVGMTLIWTISLFFQSGLSLNMATNLLPSLVMAITFAQIIFIVSHYRRTSGEAATRVANAVRRAAPPCFLAAVTTAAGFISLTATTVVPVRDFGLFAALGIAISFVVAILLVPSAIRLWPQAVRFQDNNRQAGWSVFFVRLSYRRGWIALITLIIVVISVMGIWMVQIETSPYLFFPENHPLNRARHSLHQKIEVASTIELMITRRNRSVIDSQSLSAMASLRDALIQHPLVGDTLSLLAIGELLAGDENRFIERMGTGEHQGQRSMLFEILQSNPFFRRYFSSDGRATRMTLMLRDHSAERILFALGLIESETSHTAQNLDIEPTGQTVLFIKMVDDLFLSQITSIALILIFVTIVLIFAFRSISIGLISLIPNITPIVITLGLMGMLGIPLNVLTIMVASIAIGIAVDDTIHFMYHLRGQLAGGTGYDEAIDAALLAKGRPIILTSLLLTAAFLTHLFSSFMPTIYLGALTALTMIGALIGDLVLLPALLRLFRPRFRIHHQRGG